jgi:uncharacterized protein (TIGR02099 family)
MAVDQAPGAPAGRRLALCRHLLRGGYRYLNRATCHTLGALWKLLLAVYFLFCLVFLLLRYVVLPNIDHYKSNVEQLTSRALGQPVTIGTIGAAWQGLYPTLSLGNVIIHDQRGAVALTLPMVNATLSWWSVPAAELRLRRLELDRPDIDIVRDPQGQLRIGGIALQSGRPDDGKGADWVLAQREIVIRGGQVHWIDQQRGAPELVLQAVDFTLRNDWRHHQAALKALPPAALAGPIDVRAAFDHPHFARRISDPAQWTGEVYADLRNTDLAVWKAWVDYPFDVQQGSGSVRAWLSVDRARVADFTADLNLAQVETRLAKDLQPLNLAEVTGRMSVREVLDARATDGKPTFGAHGHTIALTNFSMRSSDGLYLPRTTISETYTAPTRSAPGKYLVNARLLDLAALAGLVERLPVPASQRQLLADFAPRGQLKDFSASWQGDYPAISAYRVKGQFVGLSLNPQTERAAVPKSATLPAQAAVPAIPGFDNLSGAIDASEHSGSLDLASTALKLRAPGLFSEPVMAFDALSMRSRWTFPKKDQVLLQLERLDVVQEGVQLTLSGHHGMSLGGDGKQPGDTDLTARVARLDLNRIGRFLPLQTPDHTRNWLSGALVQGQLQDVVVHVKGDLAHFPFRVEKPGEKPKGEFTVKGKIDNGTLNYVPELSAKDSKLPLWPLAEKIKGQLLIDRTRLEVRADSAVTQNVALINVKAVIGDLLSNDAQLDIDGEASGTLQDMVSYVNVSPVLDWIGRFTEDTRATGPARLGLKLKLPLAHIIDAKVTGVLQFLNNDVTMLAVIPPLTQTTGKLEFNERGFTLNGIKANFIGTPATLSGGSQRDGNIVVKADGGVSVDGLRKTYPSATMQRLLQRASGATRFNTTINVRKHHTDVVIESTMQGFGLDLPVPLRKAATDVLPLRFELNSVIADDASLRDDIRLALGSAVSARYLRVKAADKGARWHLLRGGIGVNAPAPEPDSGVHINASLRSLNLDAWRSLTSFVAGPEKARDSAAVLLDDGVDLTQFIEPDIMAARATELIIGGKKLDNVVVGVSRQKDLWQANIDSTQASGYLSWAEAAAGRGLGKVTARLAALTIPRTATAEVSDLLEGKDSTSEIPELDLVAENFQLQGKSFGRVELLANNSVSGGGTEWRISKLSIINQDVELKASGKFSSKAGNSVSNLVYSLDISDAGKLLERFGFANVLRGGKGKMDGDLTWDGLPFSLDIPSLTGRIQLDLAAGQFLKVDPGAAKLLGVLSLQSLPRRLTLDFRDVFSQGFAFDGITANAMIAKGVARTSNFKMRSVNATVLLDGSVDIAAETQALHVVVLPEVNVGTASVVYALAINPVIGLGSFLAQLFLRDPLMRAFTFEYDISGPWKDPVVQKLDQKARAPTPPKPPAAQTGAADITG